MNVPVCMGVCLCLCLCVFTSNDSRRQNGGRNAIVNLRVGRPLDWAEGVQRLAYALGEKKKLPLWLVFGCASLALGVGPVPCLHSSMPNAAPGVGQSQRVGRTGRNLAGGR